MPDLSDELDRRARAFRPAPSTRPPGRRGGNTDGSTRPGWGKSGFKGAYRTPQGRWIAKVQHARRMYYVGTYDTPEEAAHAAAARKAELTGSKARLAELTEPTHA